jgi:hypothetical protein
MSTSNGTPGVVPGGEALERLRSSGLFVDGLSLSLPKPQAGPALVRPIVGDVVYDWLPTFEEAVRPQAGSRIAVTSRDPRLAARIACDAAAWIADRGREVVLIDGSVLSPSIGKALLEDGDEGLVDAVIFGVSSSFVARRTLATGVRLITAGSRPLSVEQVFRSDSFGKTLAGLGNVVVLVVLPEELLDLAIGWITTVVAVGEGADELEEVARSLADESGSIRPRTVAVVVAGAGIPALQAALETVESPGESGTAVPEATAPAFATAADDDEVTEESVVPATGDAERSGDPTKAESDIHEHAWQPAEQPDESEPEDVSADAQNEWPPWDDAPGSFVNTESPAAGDGTTDALPESESAARVHEVQPPPDAGADAGESAEAPLEPAEPAGAPPHMLEPEESKPEEREPSVAEEKPFPRVVVTGAATRRPRRRHGVHALIVLLALVPVIALIAWRVSTAPNASWRFWEREESVTTAPAGKASGTPPSNNSRADAGKDAGAPATGEASEGTTPGEIGTPVQGIVTGTDEPTEETPGEAARESVPRETGTVPPSTPVAGPGGSYVVFVSSHRHEAAAAREAATLASQGYASTVVATELPEKGIWHRVAVEGGFPSAAAAREVLDAVKQLGYEGAWVQRVSRNR